MANRKVGIAMSGGVDSSVTASLLKERGEAVHGFFMHLPLPGIEQLVDRVTSVAKKLNVPLEIIYLQDFFNHKVVDYFIQTYLKGETPNPCVVCNRHVKFGKLLQQIMARGMDYMATGHYARIIRDRNNRPLLKKGIDPLKDQSYFLCRLSTDQLNKIDFPLGQLTKQEVYTRAAEIGIGGIHGPESQDICFLTGETIASFFEKQGYRTLPGDVVTTNGEIIGQHQGIWRYTIGQRRGLGLPDATPWYVYHLDAGHNRVVVCKNETLLTQTVTVRDMLWNIDEPAYPSRTFARIRGSHQPAAASVSRKEDNLWTITFAGPQRAVTPGQFAVLYDDDGIVTGSGVICSNNAQHEEKKP